MNRPQADAPRSGYAAYTNTNAPEWHWLVVWDLLLNNLATGLFLAAASADLLRPALFTSILVWAYPLALVVLLADLLCLVLDLGDPLRFHHMLRVFKLSSPMSFGTWSLTAFSFPLTAIVALEVSGLVGLVEPDSGWMRPVHIVAVLAGIIPAFASAAYKGVLFSTNAQPGWRDARSLGAYLMNSAIMLGVAQLLAISLFRGPDQAALMTRQALVILLVLNIIPFALLFWELRPTLDRTYGSSQNHAGLVALAIVGFMIPIAILLTTSARIPTVFALVLLPVSSLATRAILVFLPHHATHA